MGAQIWNQSCWLKIIPINGHKNLSRQAERFSCENKTPKNMSLTKKIVSHGYYFNSGQPWHYPCIADLECNFTEEPTMDYMGLAIVLGRISLSNVPFFADTYHMHICIYGLLQEEWCWWCSLVAVAVLHVYGVCNRCSLTVFLYLYLCSYLYSYLCVCATHILCLQKMLSFGICICIPIWTLLYCLLQSVLYMHRQVLCLLFAY